MNTKAVYLLLCAAGIIVPYSQFLPFVFEHGLNPRLFMDQLLANRISAFFAADVLVSAVVLAVFMRIERRRGGGVRHAWAPFTALVTVGVSLALPLFLYLREAQADETGARTD